jgi:hypothetical protein
MDMSFFQCALEQAWKVYSVLPHKALTKTNGKTRCPLSVYTGGPVSRSNFRVMFCPVIFTYDNIAVSGFQHKEKTIAGRAKQPRLEILNRKNNPQRGMTGVHIGVPRHASGHLVFSPSTGKIYNSLDTYFDEEFNSTLALEPSWFLGHQTTMDRIVR